MRPSTRAARRVSRDLRTGRGAAVEARRRSAAWSLGASAILGFLSLYQLGLIRRLPDPPLSWIDSTRVDGSGEAYWILSAADAPIGVWSFALTAALAGAGEADRARRRPWITLAWAAKTHIDAGYGLLLALEQPARYRKACIYCLGVTACAVASARASRPDGRAAWQTMRGRR